MRVPSASKTIADVLSSPWRQHSEPRATQFLRSPLEHLGGRGRQPVKHRRPKSAPAPVTALTAASLATKDSRADPPVCFEHLGFGLRGAGSVKHDSLAEMQQYQTRTAGHYCMDR